MYSVSPTGLIALDGRVLALSSAEAAQFKTRVVDRWSSVARTQGHGVPLAWVLAIIYAESGGNEKAFRTEPSGQTGVGLMQITSPSLKGGLSDAQLFDPATNIDKGCTFLAAILKTPPRDLPAVASRYNCGANSDGSPHRAPTSRQNPSWGLCATAGYLERVSGANNVFLSMTAVAPSQKPAGGSFAKPALAALGAVLAVRYLLR